ncbi:two-component-system connector protein YcgZ [Leclercia sp. LSNIH6]|uniref:regulatory protein YcgZ n=1 Tax=unclassified Leclercia TaxID=2627398 RepID=UPI000CDD4846|nr:MULTISPECIES: regulatory protein YcgZ [unclassified Leclercia]POU71468.1 two-component-system connector protein YcgZ [Leclercia sp. LSNIH7]POU80054.1 two-component-system connector protein YcgZ [Leclercia sp. LSNIH6]POW50938.1 two-component-system connector protein YcgZ [Leclercia sp. LSNIH8]AXF64032.1 two-component-system connector protein YcgZ [Leclercia sp. W17]QGU11555.1 two-component-system connector protein YcgZ [Leclercia sp. J807]
MRENGYTPNTANAIAHYFNKANQPSQQETLGQIVVEILREGKILNRKAICTRLLYRMEQASDREEESRYQTLVGLLFDR